MEPLTEALGSFSWVIWVGAGVIILAVIWTLIQFVFKLTMKMFTLGCLGILIVGLLCGAVSFFGGR